MKVKRFFVITLIASLFVMAFSSAALAQENIVVVTPTSMQQTGWFFFDDNTNTINYNTGTFVFGPGTPPYGRGSVQISTIGTGRPNLATYQFAGIPLATITTLRYGTYNPSAGNGGSPTNSGYLQFNVDFNGTDTWQRRLVYVPRNNGTVLQDTWQEWDAINGGNAMWGYSGPAWPVTGGTGLKTWAQILADYPGVRIRVSDPFLGIRVGEPYPAGYTENIDGFKFATNDGQSVTFDFDPNSVPANQEQCKNEGWRTFHPPTGDFRNQGQCVSFVQSNRGGNN